MSDMSDIDEAVDKLRVSTIGVLRTNSPELEHAGLFIDITWLELPEVVRDYWRRRALRGAADKLGEAMG